LCKINSNSCGSNWFFNCCAGSGPSSSDSTWVNRYRKYLQNINPANQVTNLAVGGTTTYHIMPSWFLTPTGKPAVTPAKNVTMALSLNPDAIIVNMPSNDGANGFDVNEQMSNFITLYNEADTAGVQMWVCTTQPKNTNTAKKIIQTEVRDSIFNYFGNYAIDFWTTIVGTNNDIDTLYDSGDGTHLNNAGHRILYNRVVSEDIVNLVSDTLQYLDYVLNDIYFENISACGDSNTSINAVIGNIGTNNSSNLSLNFEIKDNATGIFSIIPFSISAINSCSIDTVSLVVNTYNSIDFSVRSYIVSSDTIKSNDTSQNKKIVTLGHPLISVQNDTICRGGVGMLMAQGNSINDTVIWYDSLVGGQIIGYGNNFNLSNVLTSITYYPEVVRGDLFYSNSLFTTSNASTNWNGFMFDIVANDTLTIDSIQINMNSVGAQTVIGLNRMGSHIGHESSNIGWVPWGTENITVANPGDFKTVIFSPVTLNSNDTLGVYLYLQTSSSYLSYQNSGGAQNVSNSTIQVLSGTGISHTYGTSYSPRNFSGEVFYHYGFRPQGDCISPRLAVEMVVSNSNYSLGNDTSLALNQSITLGSPISGATYLWSNSATTSQINVDTSNSSLGSNTIWVQITDGLGCVFYDTIIVTFSNVSSILESDFSSLKIYPNPNNSGFLNVMGIEKGTLIVIRDVNGKILISELFNNETIDVTVISKGLYLVSFYQKKSSITKKLIVE